MLSVIDSVHIAINGVIDVNKLHQVGEQNRKHSPGERCDINCQIVIVFTFS